MAATLSTPSDRHGGFANTGVAGYVGGGQDGVKLTRIDKLAFPAETKTTLAAVLTNGTEAIAGFADCAVL